MSPRILAPVSVAAAALLLLAGCSFNANLTVPASTIASQAEDALADQVDDFSIDCGDDAIDLVDGAEVECVLTDTNGDDYDTVVTISDVDGTTYHIDVDVPDLPVGGTEEPAANDTIVVPGDDVAAVAAGALADSLGYQPTITCSGDFDLVVDFAQRCMLTKDDNSAATVLITITEVEGTSYKIFAEVQ